MVRRIEQRKREEDCRIAEESYEVRVEDVKLFPQGYSEREYYATIWSKC